jgi:DNA-damage-inducible protein J
MSTVNVTFRVDSELKREADKLFDDLGMSLSTAFNIFLRQSVREQRLPFLVTKNANARLTATAMESAQQDRDMRGPFEDVSELMEDLNA